MRDAGGADQARRPAPGTAATAIREELRCGRTVFVVRFAASGDMPTHDVWLLGLDPGQPFAPLLRDAFVAKASRLKAITSRTALWSSVRSGLLAFLMEQDVGSFDVDEELLIRFVHWLDTRLKPKGSLALRTRRNYYRSALALLHAAAQAGVQGLHDLQIDLRADPWSGQHVSPPPPRAFLSQRSMTAILQACRSAAERVMEELWEDLRLLQDDLPGAPTIEEAKRIRALLLCHRRNAEDLDLSVAAATACTDEVGDAAVRMLLPRLADLMPFILLLAHYTGFNASTLMALQLDGIRRRSLGRSSWVLVESFKRRSDAMQRATFTLDETSTNPDRLLRFVEMWTITLRRLTGSKSLWVVRMGDAAMDLGDPAAQKAIAPRVASWLRARDLPHGNLSSIRKGILDLAHLKSGGDEAAVRAVGGQRSPDVIRRHYTSDAAHRRNRERLASAVEEMERLIGSEGRVDARRLPDASDRSAATPGFSCIDRHASPIPGEMPGRSCRAYGHCPICPLAMVDPTSPRSCGYVHLLFERVEEGLAGHTGASLAAYIATWLPIARRLRDHWMPVFDEKTRNAAKELTLIKLPEIE